MGRMLVGEAHFIAPHVEGMTTINGFTVERFDNHDPP
jgi:hypothetical protein